MEMDKQRMQVTMRGPLRPVQNESMRAVHHGATSSPVGKKNCSGMILRKRLRHQRQHDGTSNHWNNTININVGGCKRQVDNSTILRFPQTRLGQLLICKSLEERLGLCDDYNMADHEFYFDRNPMIFSYILNFYHTGRLHVMEELCAHSFSQEIEYWGIQEAFIDGCCSYRYHERKDDFMRQDLDEISQSSEATIDESMLDRVVKKFPVSRCGRIRHCLWLNLENPVHSCCAKVFALTSLVMVLLSIASMCIHSIPEYNPSKVNGKEVDNPIISAIENFCISWFTLELLLRVFATPDHQTFWRNALNIIDCVSVLPFYLTLLIDHLVDSEMDLQNVGRVIQILRLMRVLRVLKLARHSLGLRSLGATLTHSYDEIGVLLLFLTVGISMFSVLVFAVEKNELESGLYTIPLCWWWATISMTTVGYGDTYPITLMGKVVGTGCIICGILVVALPITIIFNKFNKYYRLQKTLVLLMQQSKGTSHLTSRRDCYIRKFSTFTNSISSTMDSITNIEEPSP